MSIVSNILPPILDATQNGFTGNCRIYFSIPAYNTISDIKGVQITVVDILTNKNKLLYTYVEGIKRVTTFSEDTSRQGDDRYYVEISPNDMTPIAGVNGFALNTYYKVQLRFDKVNDGTVAPSAAWIQTNLDSISEWSTATLVRRIATPTLSIMRFTSSTVTLTTPLASIIGKINFSDSTEQDYLYQYHIIFYNSNNDVIEDSGIQYATDNSINYIVKYNFVKQTNYKMVVEYVTASGYAPQSTTYNFSFSYTETSISTTLTVVPNIELGYNKIILANDIVDNLVIRRTSQESNYTLWEDVHLFGNVDDTLEELTFYDKTAESDVGYKYGVLQRNDLTGACSNMIETTNPVYLNLLDMFLINNEGFLRIRFNPVVNGLKTNYADARSETIGSQYPIIRRNGHMKYRTFTIGGLLTQYCNISDNNDNSNGFTNLIDSGCGNHYDHYAERKFRENIISFLEENNYKLFKSPTEGNIIVRLMNVNLVPENTLGRMLYSFTADAIEMDGCSAENYNKYNIQTLKEG